MAAGEKRAKRRRPHGLEGLVLGGLAALLCIAMVVVSLLAVDAVREESLRAAHLAGNELAKQADRLFAGAVAERAADVQRFFADARADVKSLAAAAAALLAEPPESPDSLPDSLKLYPNGLLATTAEAQTSVVHCCTGSIEGQMRAEYAALARVDGLLGAVETGSPMYAAAWVLRDYGWQGTEADNGFLRYHPNIHYVPGLPHKSEYTVWDSDFYKATAPAGNPRGVTRVTPVFLDDASGTRLLILTHPVADADGGYLGMAGLDVSLDALVEWMTGGVLGGPGRGVFAFALDREGEFVAVDEAAMQSLGFDAAMNPGLARELRVGLGDSPQAAIRSLGREMHRAPSGRVHGLVSGEPYRIYHHLLPKMKWRLALAVPEAEFSSYADQATASAAASARRLSLRLGAAGAVVLAATLALAVLFMRRALVSPLRDLTRAIRRISTGDYRERVDEGAAGSIAELARAFNAMAERLEASRNDLVEARERYRTIVENAVEGIFQTTPEGGYITANPAFAAMLGYDSPERLMAEVSDIRRQVFVDPARRDEFLRLMRDKGRVEDFRYQVRRRDGSKAWVSQNARAVRDEAGEPAYFEGMAVDISERLRRERAEREKRAAQEADRAKSRFLAVMSHEIRTPMNVVMGMLELAQDSELDPEVRRFLRKADESASHLLDLLQDILDFSRIEADKLSLERREFDLAELLGDIRDSFAMQADPKGVRISVETDPGLRECHGDPRRIRQVMSNLVSNAVKFTDRGTVVIRARSIGPGGKGRRMVSLEVADTGTGLDPEAAERIFEPFEQADVSASRSVGGAGLGLAIARRLAEAMGGDITMRSEPGRGSTFRVTCPL